MKTRIISGIVAAIIIALIIVLNIFWPMAVVIALALLAGLASVEMLHNTGCIKNPVVIIAAAVYSAAFQFAFSGILGISHEILTFIYIIAIIAVSLRYHQSFSAEQMGMSLAMPIILSFAFGCVESLINSSDSNGLFYLFILVNFACVSDIGAYFVGTAIGKNKLAPIISPKKTVEGAVGGVLCSVLGTLIICLIFGAISEKSVNTLSLCLITPMMSVIGMVGDLFASAIKRKYNIKDYGNIMPGHGGVLDRLDSVLLVAPAFSLFLSFAEVVI